MKHLCTGFQKTRIDYDNHVILSTHWAVLPDGAVLESGEHKRDNNFDLKGRAWKQVDARPSDSEFIGNYPIPMVSA